MRLTHEQLQTLCDLASNTAKQAGEYIAGVDRSEIIVDRKNTGTSLSSQVVTEVDRHCDQLIRNKLQQSCEQYELALLSEENSEAQERQEKNRLSQDYFWCVDPLDGTLPFTQGKPGFAVSIALVSKVGRPLIGVVYDPVSKSLIYALEGNGAYKKDALGVITALTIDQDFRNNQGALMVYADLSFKTDNQYLTIQESLNKAAHHLGCQGIEEVYGNGAVKNAVALLEAGINKQSACYLKSPKRTQGGGCIWDFAATACIVKEAGGWASDYYGQPLDLNRPESLFMNHRGVLFTSSEKLARKILSSLNF